MTVEDDGHGMSPRALAHILFHIGGSAKRSPGGASLGITATDDPNRSPNGRKLIGKIGIGLFSVSQLTRAFQVITKTKDDPFRTIASIQLRQYGDDAEQLSGSAQQRYESGKVNVWRERASDVSSHGTSIVLSSIRNQAKTTLQSRELWNVIDHNNRLLEVEPRPQAHATTILPPTFHIGRVDQTGHYLSTHGKVLRSLPWEPEDDPSLAFKKLVDAVWDQVGRENPNPRLESLFDNYLRMVWQLSLAVPLPYVNGSLFELTAKDTTDYYRLGNSAKSTAERVVLSGSETIAQSAGVSDDLMPLNGFEVTIDKLRLFRPLKFRDLPVTEHATKRPLFFVGSFSEKFEGTPRELSGGPLMFDAYLMWSPKIAPTEHQGSLVRIHGASGTLFDPTFLRYQVSEQTRLRQISCEIFVREGLDSALNIDRESFNSAHPHTVAITRWLHGSLRQVASAQKRIAAELRMNIRAGEADSLVDELRGITATLWIERHDDEASAPPSIVFASRGDQATSGADAFVFARDLVLRDAEKTERPREVDLRMEATIRAIAQTLAAFGLLDSLAKFEQESLLRTIRRILQAAENR